jgi:hypothetical protein
VSRKAGDWLDTYLKYSDFTEPKRSFRLWTGISVLSAAVQRSIQFTTDGISKYYPNMYVLLVAPPGLGRKGTAMKYGKELLTASDISIAPATSTREGFIAKLASVGNDFGQEESASKDATDPNSYITHSSLSVFSDEFTVFIGRDNSQFVTDLCDLFDCPEEWEYYTKTEELRNHIENVFVSIFGATTPKELIKAVVSTNADGGGLLSRMIIVYEHTKGKSSPLQVMSAENKQRRKNLIHDLKKIKKLSGQFKITKEFIEFYAEWYTRRLNEFKPRAEALQYYVGRRQVHLLKLSMLMSISRSDSLILELQDIERALKELEAVEARMHVPFEGMGARNNAEVMGSIIHYLRQNTGVEMKLIDLFNLNKLHISLSDLKTLMSELHEIDEIDYWKDSNGNTIVKHKGVAYDTE